MRNIEGETTAGADMVIPDTAKHATVQPNLKQLRLNDGCTSNVNSHHHLPVVTTITHQLRHGHISRFR